MYRLVSKISCVGLNSAKDLKPASSEVHPVLKVLLLSAAPVDKQAAEQRDARE